MKISLIKLPKENGFQTYISEYYTVNGDIVQFAEQEDKTWEYALINGETYETKRQRWFKDFETALITMSPRHPHLCV